VVVAVPSSTRIHRKAELPTGSVSVPDRWSMNLRFHAYPRERKVLASRERVDDEFHAGCGRERGRG
jgi:hypothetical protein